MTVMTMGFAALLVIHGLIHILGAAKAFGWADLPQLTQPISPAMGTLWLVSALLWVAAAVSLFVWPRWWWAIAACALAVSMVVIVPSWADAKAGAAANGLVFVGIVFGFLSQGPLSLRAEYDNDVRRHVATVASPSSVTDADLAHLPGPVQKYLRMAGVVGHPRVRNFRVRLHGRIRSDRDGRWMPLAAEQFNVVGHAARLFYLNASMFAIPVQGYHRYVGSSASMRVKVAALVPVADAAGPEMTQSETVTLFNDMCLMAPATLIEPSIEWESIDERTARARFTNAGHTIGAVLSFNDTGELIDFESGDRSQGSADGAMIRRKWSTPVRGYRTYGSVRLLSSGEGRWHDADGSYPYIELTIDDVRYNVQPG